MEKPVGFFRAINKLSKILLIDFRTYLAKCIVIGFIQTYKIVFTHIPTDICTYNYVQIIQKGGYRHIKCLHVKLVVIIYLE